MKISFVASSTSQAQNSLQELEKLYGICPLENADVVVTLGGDGLVLKTFDSVVDAGTPVFAMRRTSSVGFLCNDYSLKNLPDRIQKAQKVGLHPLRVDTVGIDGSEDTALAINEIVAIRDSPQSARLCISVDGVERISQYSGDGLLVSTPAGSTAYNHSAGGPIMPLDANTLVMTAICGFRPRRWSYAVMPQDSVIDLEVLETEKRPVRIEAGLHTTPNVARARLRLDRSITFTLLFDPEKHLGERIVQEQFMM